MSTSLLDKEKITTTLAKAKELRRFTERLVTLSKRETLHARRLVSRHVHDRKVVAKLFDTLSARYAARPGGYTRILKLGPRRGDNAEMALIELVGAQSETADEKPSKPKRKGKTAAKRQPAKKTAAKEQASKKSPTKKKETKRKAAVEGSKKAVRRKTGKKRSSKA
jgi:large subunit ribosomal protein L17